MHKVSMLLAAALIAGSTGLALAQAGGGGAGAGGAGGAGGEGPKPGDAQPPGALKKGGIPPAAAARRGDDMAPVNQSTMGQKKSMKRTARHGRKHRKHVS